MDDPAIDLVFIASNHASHADYAVEALRRGKSVHVEKPPVVSLPQLTALCDAMRSSTGKVALGFNRPHSPLGRATRDILATQSGPGSYNWFVAGHELPEDHWYYDEGEGGRILGNLCHWVDFLYFLVPASGRYPIEVSGVRPRTSECDFVVSYVFSDGSMGSITFSAKGHAFEGVKERFSAQRGDVILALDDFSSLFANVGARCVRRRSVFRDHGHEERICGSYLMLRDDLPGCTTEYVWETCELSLATRAAVEGRESVAVSGKLPATNGAAGVG
jgi:predicted dehydrogenase